MAEETVKLLVCDLTGEKAEIGSGRVQTVPFALGREAYTIDLVEEEAEKLRDTLRYYIARATKLKPEPGTGRGRRVVQTISGNGHDDTATATAAAPKSAPIDKEQGRAIRRWWAELPDRKREALNLKPAAQRGKLPPSVVEAWQRTYAAS